jgi:Flp pilus assembly protein TadD
MIRHHLFFRPLCCAMVLSLVVAGCAPSRQQVTQKDVQQLLEEMKGPEVPTLDATILEAAKEAEDSGNYMAAAQFYQQLADKNTDNMTYQFRYAEALRRGGAFAEAITQYRKIEGKKALRLDALEGIGLSQMALAEFDAAGDTLADVMEQDTTRWRTINAIGILFTIRGMYPEARQYFAEALVQQPKSVAVRNNMALMEAFDKQYDEAIRILTEAARQARSEPELQRKTELNLALVYAIKGDLKNAEQVAQEHLTESQLLNNMGYYAHLAKDDMLAKSYLNMALTSSNKHYEKAWQNLETLNKLVSKTPGR